MSQYVRDRWGSEQGFPRGPVYAITQTADGYLWIGTEAGLVRFDGWRFNLIPENSGSFNVVNVLALMPDIEGNLWVQLPGPRMLRYHDGVFENPLAELPYSNITAMSRANEGRLLASSSEHGAIVFRQGSFEMLVSADNLPRSPVISIAQTSEGNVWMGTRDAGLFRLSGNQATAVTIGLPDAKINCLLAGEKGELWVGTDNGVVRWNGAQLTNVTPGSSRRLQALAMARDRDSNLWVGTDSRGLLRINDQGVSSLTVGGPGDAVTAVFEDREGNLWIGSANGLERLRDSAFVTYSPSEDLPTDGNIPVFVDSENRTWFPSLEGGLWWSKDGLHGRVGVGGLDRDVVYSIAGVKGELWLGRQRGGLTRLRFVNGSFRANTYTQSDGLAQNSVYSVHQSSDGTVWAGTLSGGVSRLENGKFTTYSIADGLASDTIATIAEGSDGTMWFGTPGGLSSLKNGRWRSYTASDGLPSVNVNCLLEDSGGVLWVGTGAGLAFRKTDRFQAPSGAPASLSQHVLGIAEDRYGSLWISTPNHVLRVRRDQLLLGKSNDGDVREYGLADGLRGVEGVKRHRSVVADPLGRIWFSMNRGISVVDPGRLANNSVPATAHVQTISADGSPIDLRGSVRIPAGRQRITFSYAGLSLSVPERVRFRYWLDGFDRRWSDLVSAREAIYTNLSPGSYRFRVIASNPDGVWSTSEASIAFEVEPLFWQTWWFRLASVLVVACSIAAVYRFRLHRMTRQLNVRFEERLAERTRIAQELHDTLLQGFLSASMQLHVATDRLPDDSPAKPPLTRVLQLVGQVIEEGRNAVRGLRSTDGPHDLAQTFSRIQQEIAMEEETDFRVIVEGHPRPLHPVLRDEVYRIGREALVNAFRHSRAKNIELELEYAAKSLRILVRDDGCGIDPSVLRSGREGHWGLPGMRERAEKIGGSFHVRSSATAGTEIELSVPGLVAFQSQASNGMFRWLKRHVKREAPAGPESKIRSRK